MKRLLLAAVLLVLLAGGYYFRGFFFKTEDLTGRVYEHRLSSGNPDELYRSVPVVEAQMRRLPGLQDVNSDLQVETTQTIVEVDRQTMRPVYAMLPGITISFKVAPGVALGEAIHQIQDMEKQLALPATITSVFSERLGR
jgi:multidrug efflux pump subunit AcrB